MAYTIKNNIPNTTYKVVSGVVTVTANSGYKIDGTPTIDNYDEAGLMGRVWLDLTVSADQKTASVDLAGNSVSEMYDLVLKGNTVEDAAYLINNTVGNTTYEVSGDTLTVRSLKLHPPHNVALVLWIDVLPQVFFQMVVRLQPLTYCQMIVDCHSLRTLKLL